MNRKKFINAKIKGVDELQEILVEDGVFKEISSHIDATDCPVIDLQGKLTLPPYVDPHIHLDYVFTARKQGAKKVAVGKSLRQQPSVVMEGKWLSFSQAASFPAAGLPAFPHCTE